VSPGECVGAIWHHPVVSTGAHGSLTKMRAIFVLLDQAAYDADLILEGHDHNYERFAKHSSTGAASASGIQSVVVGTGGTEHRPFTLNPLPVTVIRNADTHGVLVGELTPTGGRFDFRRANYSGNGNFTDQFTVSCN
jgi:acid phosphatase type 7